MKTIGAIIGEDGLPRGPKNETEAVKLAIFSELARQQADHGAEPLIFPLRPRVKLQHPQLLFVDMSSPS